MTVAVGSTLSDKYPFKVEYCNTVQQNDADVRGVVL